MNPREKRLAIGVGALGGLLAIWMLYSQVTAMFDFRAKQIQRLTQEVAGNDRIIEQGRVATREMQALRERSLPADPKIGEAQYRAWLMNMVEAAKLDNTKVMRQAGTLRGSQVFSHLGMKVTGRGDLQQLTRLLYSLYAVDRTQRVSKLNLRPSTADPKQLEIEFEIEAIAIKDGPPRKELTEIPSERVTGDLDSYLDRIVGRNFFAPGNNPPKFQALTEQRVSRDADSRITVKADPGDERQKVSYALLGHTLPAEPKIDAASGEVRFTPTSNGQYELTVQATDDGLPAKSDQLVVKVQVTDPPPSAPPPPKFDSAKFAFFTAIVERDGVVRAWLILRTTGEKFELAAGDKFSVGEVHGVVKQIRAKEMEFEVNNELFSLRQGQNLGQSQRISRTASS